MNLADLIQLALKEDMPEGDLTTESLGIESKLGRAHLVAKEDLILSGRDMFTRTMHHMDSSLQIRWHFEDSKLILKGQTVASLKGNLVPVIKAERVALNFLGRLSGISTFTSCFVRALGDSKTKILDTRKTLPLYRELEKKAVKDGGGYNHRLNLSDAIMIKENHIRLAGSLEKALEQVRANTSKAITLECTSLDEVKKAVSLKVERILLDNMNNEQLQDCLKLIPASIETEASGNMSIERVEEIANFGLNYISIGALTHSAPNADFSLLFEWEDGNAF